PPSGGLSAALPRPAGSRSTLGGGARSSAGQSSGLIIRRSLVRIQAGPLLPRTASRASRGLRPGDVALPFLLGGAERLALGVASARGCGALPGRARQRCD